MISRPEQGTRFESSVLSLSWIPSEAVTGLLRLPFAVGLARYDDPPPDEVTDPASLVAADRVRFSNELRAWVKVVDGRIVDCGYLGRGRLNVSTVHLPGKDISFAAIGMPDLQHEPDMHDEYVIFTQTAGGRTGSPLPRRVERKPFIQLAAPLAWTTLTLTIDSAGRARGTVAGASPFPRHWIYDASGRLVSKTGLIDFDTWYRATFGPKTPWGDTDSPAFVTDVESSVERELSRRIMRGGKRPHVRQLARGETLLRQGDRGTTIYLLLDGVLKVEVDGEPITEVGPGAILGERAILEGGIRTSTLSAVTPCRVVEASVAELDLEALSQVSVGHRREDQRRLH